MFDHSIKVPRLYKTAARIAKQVSEGRGSVKELVYEANHPNIKALYALVASAFQHAEDIDKLLKKSKLLTKEPRFDSWLAKILITELLWGKKRLLSQAKPIKTVLAYEQIFKAHMSDASSSFVDVRRVEKPKYARVNTLKITTNEVVEMFRDEGWILKRCPEKNYTDFLDAVANLSHNEFMTDLHVPDLLIFPPKTQFYSHVAYKKSHIILQDKASCFPVHILNPEIGSTILDMCAAPGMKTTQTAAFIRNQGLIYAVEIREKRYQTLSKIVEECGATCVKTLNKDVTTLTEKDLRNVEYILVDPSCSGSGLTDRVEIGLQKQDRDVDRLLKLAAFQITLLRYALTKFSKAKRVVYSTCSVYPEENEDVVRQVLETCTDFKLVPAGDFVRDCWFNFGSPEFGDIGNFCLYAKPDIDLTSGFFVAVFERLGDGERNPFLNYSLFVRNKSGQNKDKSVKKKKERKEMVSESGSNQETEFRDEAEKVDGRKKKSKKENDQKNDASEEIKNEEEIIENTNTDRSKKQKIKIEDQVSTTIENEENIRDFPVKKKKKKHKHNEENFAENDKHFIEESKEDRMKDENVKFKTSDEDGKKKKSKKEVNVVSEEIKNEEEAIENANTDRGKRQKIKIEDQVSTTIENEENTSDFPVKKKKKKHKHNEENFIENDKNLVEESKKDRMENENVKLKTDDQDENYQKKKKKNKNKNEWSLEENDETMKNEEENLEVTKSPSKKRKQKMKEEKHAKGKTEIEENFQNFEDTIENTPENKKKKRKREKSDDKNVTNFITDELKIEREENEQKLVKKEELEYRPSKKNENQYTDFTDIETKKKKKKKNRDKNTEINDEINNLVETRTKKKKHESD